ncbi:MAG: DUF47 family protein [Phycisphaerae bacterium]|nr:DUF47 family protein [Phycisphaerae bacterium]
MFFISKKSKIEDHLAQYRKELLLCMNLFRQAMAQYIKDTDHDVFKAKFRQIHKAESKADDIRGEIEVLMYSKGIFPESRGDVMILLEFMDKVPNQIEAAARLAINQFVTVPDIIANSVAELLYVGQRCVEAMLDGSAALFDNYTAAVVPVGKVDELESQADHIQDHIIEIIFSNPDIKDFDKIMLRDLINYIANITDRCENVGDRIRVIAAKRSV